MAIKFSGINIHAKDPVKSFGFYKGLGFTVTEEAAADSEYYGATFDLGGSTLWIWRDDGDNAVENNRRKTIEIVLGMDGLEDMQESYKKLITMGYAISEPKKQFYGGWEMKLTDPDGNRILFLD